MRTVTRAILSVSDKVGLVELARGLARHGVELLSTGGTAQTLAEARIATVAIAEYTGAPEILDGRVKTLHPKVHGGLLGRDTGPHREEMRAHAIRFIDLVVVNLYPFEKTVANPQVAFADAIETIDIGGPALIRSAAKNHERVAVLVDPGDYAALLSELDAHGGAVTPALRFRLAQKAFAHTAAYDGAIAAYLSSFAEPAGGGARAALPGVLTVQWRRARSLRYGENPHQKAALYRDLRSPLGTAAPASLADAAVLQGKELSYNNFLDLDAALACCLEFSEPTAVIVKHTNPCGVASDLAGIAPAYQAARETDPTSAFGGIVAANRAIDEQAARILCETFLECIIAPGYSNEARAILAEKKNLRLLALPFTGGGVGSAWALRQIAGGVLVQSADRGIAPAGQARVVTARAPSAEELSALDFAWRVSKHVKSNAIVFCRDRCTAAVGAGQMSRVDSVRIARLKAQRWLAGTAVASDAFFPFRDGLDAVAEAGATAVIQPGGSVRDSEVIAAADEHGIAMVFTGMRHFRH